ncbi:MAG TPA: cytochrome c oxidase assembly protein [Vicinamibacterales bacterium]|nr:cytochrome c oxidase assembly protein [Vicinamibacterales bacterium]
MRTMPLWLGSLALAAVWLGPLPALAPGHFSAHMTMHMGVVAIGAPLLACGLASSRFDPVGRLPGVFSAIPASIAELVVVWAWHTPALHHLARHTTAGLLLEQGTFLGSGLLVWLAAVGGRHDRDRHASGVVALLLTSMHMTLLGALIALAPRPLYHGPADPRTALWEQQLGGAIMLLVGGVVYLAGGLWLSARVLRGSAALREPGVP